MDTNLMEDGYSIHANARKKGFWDHEATCPDVFYIKQMAMIHSEVSEILEAFRKERGTDAVEEEFADVLIRLLDLYIGLHRAGYVKRDLVDVLHEKMQHNTTRPHMHGVRG